MGLEEEVEEEEVVVEVCTDVNGNSFRLSHHCLLVESTFIFSGFRNDFKFFTPFCNGIPLIKQNSTAT